MYAAGTLFCVEIKNYRGIISHASPLAPPVVTAPPPARPGPPQSITKAFSVTRQLIYVATQTFEGQFTVDDVVERMANGEPLPPEDRKRIRSNVSQLMSGAMTDRGEVLKLSEGRGKTPAWFAKADASKVRTLSLPASQNPGR